MSVFAPGRGRARRRAGMLALAAASAALATLTIATRADLRPVPGSLRDITGSARATQLLDRRSLPLNVTFENDWNVHDIVALHEMPEFLKLAFVHAEDKRFREHRGVDWLARVAALRTNIQHLRPVRGASTISEQVVRMLHPRPRTLWSRWLEGFEAARLERKVSKDEILEFYLNQVPYAANRRGVQQAASYYFDRDLETLNQREMLALAVLVRSPSRLDLHRSVDTSKDTIVRLADSMQSRGQLSAAARDSVLGQHMALQAPRLPTAAPHFVRHAEAELAHAARQAPRAVTTLDSALQREVQQLLDRRIESLHDKRVEHGAVLVADNASGEVLAWVVAGGGDEAGPRHHIDAVTTRRQPGSALKPFVYALALDSGWTAAEVIDDTPLAEDVGTGLHNYQNYSRRFYGPIALRDALGNSLNIPALRTLHFVGAERYLGTLRTLGFAGLTEHPNVYGDGIALGNGAVSLFELVQAYTALANRGVLRPLRVLWHDPRPRAAVEVFSAEAASLIGDILSDPEARSLEFGRASVLGFPVQTAVKTGTSSDYRDAWAVGFDARHTVGVWMGNLDQTPTVGVTGATGPALLLRSVFSELSRGTQSRPLYLSPALVRRSVCVPMPAAAGADCRTREEWFLAGTQPADTTSPDAAPIRIRQPTPGLQMAFDPRLPPAAQAFEFLLEGLEPGDRVRWTIDGRDYDTGASGHVWPVTRGDHSVDASVWRGETLLARIRPFEFTVK